MRAVRRSLLLLLAPLLLASCASDGVQTTSMFDPLARFPAEATYAWDARASSLPENRAILDLDPDALIRETVDEALLARGYRVTTSDDSDYLMSYELNVARVIRPDVQRSIGSLWLLMRDADEKDRVWAGYMKADVNISLSDEERRAALAKNLKRVFENFPPNTAAN